MNILLTLRERFARALDALHPDLPADERGNLIEMVRPNQEAKFGDYQANLAMPLAKRLGQPPRDVAKQIIGALEVSDLCQPLDEPAGPGFINLKLSATFIERQLAAMFDDERLGVPAAKTSRTYVLDYSGPNVAKPMHVGHIRSTVIGDALARMLRFSGHRVITDNHLGDWGTQFGMIIYGYRHFLDQAAYERSPVTELARLYRLVSRLVGYHEGREQLPKLATRLAEREQAVVTARASQETATDPKATKKELKRLEQSLAELKAEKTSLEQSLVATAGDPALAPLLTEHADIGQAVLAETVQLHRSEGDNRELWQRFMPACLADIERIYKRLDIQFDHTLGESFYHEMLAEVVDEFRARGLARTSEGALCVFLDGFEAPMLIQKQDGAYLYATTDLATIRYRLRHWHPDAILYVVDHRQGLHFEQLFAAARLCEIPPIELTHVKFGTVLGDDNKPFKTRSGDTVGLEGLLDEAVERAHQIVSANDDAKPSGAELDAQERRRVAEAVGIAALKYADLTHNRASDYVFSYDKMLAMNGNTATYMQYAYARVQSIFAKGEIDRAALCAAPRQFLLESPQERALAIELLRLPEAISQALADYYPHHLTGYLFALANAFSAFFENCPVLKAESAEKKHSRLLLCELTARVIGQGLTLLGIRTAERM